jgi:hypothetical protein
MSPKRGARRGVAADDDGGKKKLFWPIRRLITNQQDKNHVSPLHIWAFLFHALDVRQHPRLLEKWFFRTIEPEENFETSVGARRHPVGFLPIWWC